MWSVGKRYSVFTEPNPLKQDLHHAISDTFDALLISHQRHALSRGAYACAWLPLFLFSLIKLKKKGVFLFTLAGFFGWLENSQPRSK